MVGEIKKGKCVYYHCSGARGKCPEPYIVTWISTALRESHGDQKRFRYEAIAKLKADHLRLQKRLDVMYEDRLDGRIDVSLFERKSGEYRQEQARILTEIEGYGAGRRPICGGRHQAA
jgi:hypothetical protein